MSIGNFFAGLLVAVIGYLIVWKSNWLMNNFGRISWAEAHLGTEGGSRLLYKIIGFVIIIAGFLHATNLAGALIKWIATSLFGAKI